MRKLGLAALSALAISLAAPNAAFAQSELPAVPAGWVEIGMIEVEDGRMLDYANYLAGNYRKAQDYAKSQGWITDYQIWANSYPRDGEPDIYIVTWFPSFVDDAESQRRNQLYREYMKSTQAQMEAESGMRAEYRRQMGSMLLRNYRWAN